MKSKVLVLGSNSRSCLTIVRSLGRKGIKVHLAWHDPDSIVLYSRYIDKVHDIARYGDGNDSWQGELKDLLAKERFELVIPNDDAGVRALIGHRAVFSKLAKLALPNEKAFEYSFNKNKTYELAQEIGLPVPKQIEISSIDECDIFDQEWSYPLVIKPVASSVVLKNSLYFLKVAYAESKEELIDRLKPILSISKALVQEYFVGTGVGLEFLSNNGQICVAFQHVRVHEPMTGGGSAYRKSVVIDDELLQYVKMIVEALEYTGVAMVEFKYNFEKKEFVLIEINGRFWGSLPLAIASGVDFPYYLYEMIVHNRRNFPTEYRTGIYCRNLFMDASWFIRNLKTKPGSYNNAKPLTSVILEFSNILLLRERSDTFVLDDLYPALVELKMFCKRLCRALIRRFRRLYYSSRYSKRLQKHKLETLAPLNSLAFVCKGNICRSPFAAAYVQKRLCALGKNAHIDSYGYYPKSNRLCPDNAIDAANRFGVDLKSCRSKIVSKEVLLQFDAIIVFDVLNYLEICSRFDSLKDRILFLGVLSDKPTVDFIGDPYGGNIDCFVETYESIAALVDLFFQETTKLIS